MARCLCNVRYDQIKPLQNEDELLEEAYALGENLHYMDIASNKVMFDLQYQYAQTRLDLIRDYLKKRKGF